MLCPYCQAPLQDTAVLLKNDQSDIAHECFTCGGHWLSRWLANDLPTSQAITLDSVTPQHDITRPETPRCPQCQTRLSLIKHDSVPKGLHVWTCPEGHGNFFPKGELLKFKKAQEAKITYHTLWGVPIKSVFAVLLPVAIVITLAAGIPLTLKQLSTPTRTSIKADEVISTPAIIQTDNTTTIISFTTTTPGIAQLNLYQGTRKLSTTPASKSSTTIHSTTLENLDPSQQYTYTITLITADTTITSDPFTLTLSKNLPTTTP